MTETKSGLVAIIGPTNAGKSSFLNKIMGLKASIVSHKVQTTRTQIRAVKMVGDTQIVFIDTPGIFRPARRLDRAMVSSAYGSLSDADATLLIMDATKGITDTIKTIIEKIKTRENIYIVLNKVDLIKKEKLLPLTAELSSMANWNEIFMTSALKGTGIDEILTSLAKIMPESPYLFDPEDTVDINDKIYASEITREKIYKYIHQELPYHIYVATDKIERDKDDAILIHQTIYVGKENYKKILIGKGGENLQKIGTESRFDLQQQWGEGVRLNVFVKVDAKWEERSENYEDMGLEFNS